MIDKDVNLYPKLFNLNIFLDLLKCSNGRERAGPPASAGVIDAERGDAPDTQDESLQRFSSKNLRFLTVR